MGKVVGAVGQIAFGWIGGAIGGPVGFAIGNLVGGLIFGQAAPMQEPSRLSDLTVQGSEYGITIPIFYGGTIADGTHGGVPTTGNIIDADPRGGIEEVASQSSVKRGTAGKKKKQTVTEYSYFLTCAIMFGEGPQKIDKFWADEKVMFDRFGIVANDADPQPVRTDFPATLKGFADYVNANNAWRARQEKAEQGWKMVLEPGTGAEMCEQARFYPGNFKQLPDVALQQFHEGIVPAYRGSCYCVILKLALADFNNRVPTFRALLTNGVTDKREMVRRHMKRSGLADKRIDLCEIDGQLLGAFQTSQGGARDFIEKIAAHSLCEIAEWDGKVKDISKMRTFAFPVDAAHLAAHYADEEVPDRISFDINQSEQIPSECDLRFLDYDNDFEPNIAVGLGQFTADHTNVLTLEMPIVDRLPDISPLAQIIIDEAIESRYNFDLRLLPGYIRRVPGNGLIVPTPTGDKHVRITGMNIGAPGVISITGRSYNKNVYLNQRKQFFPNKEPNGVIEYGEPDVRLFDPPALSDDMVVTPGLIVASTAGTKEPYVGSATKFVRTDQMGDQISIIARAIMGTTTSDLVAAPTWEIDWTHTLAVTLKHGTLESITLEQFHDTEANTALVNGNLIRFLDADEVGPGQWELTGIVFGQKGSEYTGTVLSGANFLLLTDSEGVQTDGWAWAESTKKNMGKQIHFQDAPLTSDGNFSVDHDFDYEGNAMYPLAPGRPTITRDEDAETVTLEWDMRSRYDNSGWWRGETPRMSDPSIWEIVMSDGITEVTIPLTGVTEKIFTYAELAGLFGDSAGPYTGTIQQYNDANALKGRLAYFAE